MYNVVHWSSSDYIVAALQKNIYLWHVSTSTIAHTLFNPFKIPALRLDKLGERMVYAQQTKSDKRLIV